MPNAHSGSRAEAGGSLQVWSQLVPSQPELHSEALPHKNKTSKKKKKTELRGAPLWQQCQEKGAGNSLYELASSQSAFTSIHLISGCAVPLIKWRSRSQPGSAL